MATPWPHPKTGIYHLRRAIPADLRELLGKREEKISLKTRDVAAARRVFAEANAEVERRWALARRARAERPEPPALKTVGLEQAKALAGILYRRIIEEHGQDAGEPDTWREALRRDQLVKKERFRAPDAPRTARTFADSWGQQVVRRYGPTVDALLRERGLLVDPDSRIRIVREVAKAFELAHAQLLRKAETDRDPDPGPFPPDSILDSLERDPVLLEASYERFAAEAQHSAPTRKKWLAALKRMTRDVGKDDLRAITKADMIAWKDELLRSGMSGETVRDGYLAAAKALFNYLVDGQKIAANPVAGVVVRGLEKRKVSREKGFTYDEAITILSATLEPASRKSKPEGAAARRWIPWLCAYAGARVNEITQLRASDVRCERGPGYEQGIWIMRISPEAGSVKTGRYRDVPLHPHLIEQGFLEFVRSRQGKHLFYEPGRARVCNAAHPQYKKVGERLAARVRKIGIDDPELAPNHAWRHRFKSVCKDAEIHPEIRDVIQGHAPRTEGEAYGDTWPQVAYRAICRLPRYEVEERARSSARA